MQRNVYEQSLYVDELSLNIEFPTKLCRICEQSN